MSACTDSQNTAPRRLLTFSGGGWVLLLAGVLVVAVTTWRVISIVQTARRERIGDGRTVESYQFDLSACRIPRDRIVAGGRAKDMVPTLSNPPALTPEEAVEINREQRRREHSKFLVPLERVIGVVVQGQARAYPVRALAWHEVVNDTLGDLPIAVTYSYLCDSVVVYERRAAGQALQFGLSGLYYNSNPLLFDRREGGKGESLWSQLDGRAVAGPAAARGQRLAVIPSALTTWEDWCSLHPQTTVLAADPEHRGLYKSEPVPGYLQSDELVFPVSPDAPTDAWARKTRVVAVEAGGQRRVYPLPVLADRAEPGGQWHTTLGGVPLTFVYRAQPRCAWVTPEPPDTPIDVRYAFWFAWHALHPDDPVLSASAPVAGSRTPPAPGDGPTPSPPE